MTDPNTSARVVTAEILSERMRQISVEHFTHEHDNRYTGGELSMAAATYAISDKVRKDLRCPYIALLWPWGKTWWKPKSRRHDLIRAGALIIAEIERIDRKDQSKNG